MGCDIHAFIEYKAQNIWEAFSQELNLARNYAIFGALANVREKMKLKPILPRGLPNNLSIIVKVNYDESFNSHTPSWVNTQEVESILNMKEIKESILLSPEYNAMLATMKELEKKGFKARLVFWFDN